MTYFQKVLLKVGIVFVIMTTIILIAHFNGLKHDLPRKNSNEFGEYYYYKVNQFREENRTLKNGEVDVAFLGDSLTDLCDLSKYYSYYNVVNRGIGGDKTDGLLNRLDVSAYAFNPKAIVLLIGINNLNTMFDDYEDILKELKSHLPYTKVVILSLAPVGEALKSMNPTIKFQNTRLEKLAKKYNYEYVDIFTPLYNKEADVMYPEYTTDMLHFSDQGYKVISGTVMPVLKRLLG